MSTLPTELLFRILEESTYSSQSLLSLARTSRKLYSLYDSREESLLHATLLQTSRGDKGLYGFALVLGAVYADESWALSISKGSTDVNLQYPRPYIPQQWPRIPWGKLVNIFDAASTLSDQAFGAKPKTPTIKEMRYALAVHNTVRRLARITRKSIRRGYKGYQYELDCRFLYGDQLLSNLGRVQDIYGRNLYSLVDWMKAWYTQLLVHCGTAVDFNSALTYHEVYSLCQRIVVTEGQDPGNRELYQNFYNMTVNIPLIYAESILHTTMDNLNAVVDEIMRVAKTDPRFKDDYYQTEEQKQMGRDLIYLALKEGKTTHGFLKTFVSSSGTGGPRATDGIFIAMGILALEACSEDTSAERRRMLLEWIPEVRSTW